MRVPTLFLTALLALGAGAPIVDAQAQQPVMVAPNYIIPTQGRPDAGRQNIRPLREVVDELRSRYGGELISARLEEGGRPIYVLRWRLPDGQVRDFRVPAAR